MVGTTSTLLLRRCPIRLAPSRLPCACDASQDTFSGHYHVAASSRCQLLYLRTLRPTWRTWLCCRSTRLPISPVAERCRGAAGSLVSAARSYFCRFATTFGDVTMGLAGEIILSVSIAISCFGSSNGGLFVASRIVHASARDADLPFILSYQLGTEEPTPVFGILFQGSNPSSQYECHLISLQH